MILADFIGGPLHMTSRHIPFNAVNVPHEIEAPVMKRYWDDPNCSPLTSPPTKIEYETVLYHRTIWTMTFCVYLDSSLSKSPFQYDVRGYCMSRMRATEAELVKWAQNSIDVKWAAANALMAINGHPF